MRAKPDGDRGSVTIDAQECKGCGLCVDACAPDVLHLADFLNPFGYHPAVYSGSGCTGCAVCFFVCPEPGAITVYLAEGARAAREKS